MFITSGQNVIKSIDLFILYHIFNLKEIPHPPSYRHNKSPRKAIAAALRDFCPPMAQTPFLKGVQLSPGILVLWRGIAEYCRFWAQFRFSPLTGILVRWHYNEKVVYWINYWGFSPLTGILVRWRIITDVSKTRVGECFSPLTGILVRWLCLSVPAPRLGSQAIFSNLRLFGPFSLTRVKNKIEAVSFIRLVMPFFAGLKIFKPTGFLALKSVFQRSVVLWLISSIRFSSFVVKRISEKGSSSNVLANASNRAQERLLPLSPLFIWVNRRWPFNSRLQGFRIK